ncbi:MAG: agmatine deiminase family protein [Balneolaceae bacterium]
MNNKEKTLPNERKRAALRMPAEWERHSGTLLIWPSNMPTWPGERLSRVEVLFLTILDTIQRFEPVLLLVHPSITDRALGKIRERKIPLDLIQVQELKVNDMWARDCGPISVRNRFSPSKPWLFTDWEYNAWGGKYPPWDDDNRIPSELARLYSHPIQSTGMILEGGSVEPNGRGVLLTTESVLLNPNRNPKLSRTDIENHLYHYLGAKQVIWLEAGLAGDDTDGHIDDLSRFLNPETILTSSSENPAHPNYKTLHRNLERLQQARNHDGKSFTIEVLPLPDVRAEGGAVDGSIHLPASYTNFYIANSGVLVPLYDSRYDRQALDLFRRYFPDREIIGVPCRDLIWGQGGIHCITQPLFGLNPLCLPTETGI